MKLLRFDYPGSKSQKYGWIDSANTCRGIFFPNGYFFPGLCAL
jgi:hypothetical protein